MDKAYLLGSLFLRLSTIYGGSTHGDLIELRQAGKRKRTEAEDRLEKAPWRVDLIRKELAETAPRSKAA